MSEAKKQWEAESNENTTIFEFTVATEERKICLKQSKIPVNMYCHN